MTPKQIEIFEDSQFVGLTFPEQGLTAKDDADRTIDLLNNQIGRAIGEQNKDADNITTAKAVATEYYKNGLYTMAGNDKDGYKIQKTKLTKSQYETTIKEIDKKGQDGMNKPTDEKKQSIYLFSLAFIIRV